MLTNVSLIKCLNQFRKPVNGKCAKDFASHIEDLAGILEDDGPNHANGINRHDVIQYLKLIAEVLNK